MVGFPDWLPNVSLLAADVKLASGTGQTLTAVNGATLYAGLIGNVSYNFQIAVLNDGTPVTPVCRVRIQWLPYSGGPVIDQQDWFIWTTDTSTADVNMLVTGRGPTSAGYVQVLLHNYDAGTVTYDFQFYSSARVVTRHDIRSTTFYFASEYTYNSNDGYAALGAPANGILGQTPGIGLVNAASAYRYLPLYCGQVQLSCHTESGAADAYFTLLGVNPDLANPTPTLLTLKSDSNGNVVAENVSLPRGPTILKMENLNASTQQLAYSMVIQEFAS